jgi:hypothetical protein
MLGSRIIWDCVRPGDYVPGDGRVMTGVMLTKAGWALVAEEEAKREGEATKATVQ